MVGFIYIKIPASERLVFLIPIANRIRGRLVTIPVVGRSAHCIGEIVEFFKFKNRYKINYYGFGGEERVSFDSPLLPR